MDGWNDDVGGEEGSIDVVGWEDGDWDGLLSMVGVDEDGGLVGRDVGCDIGESDGEKVDVVVELLMLSSSSNSDGGG